MSRLSGRRALPQLLVAGIVMLVTAPTLVAAAATRSSCHSDAECGERMECARGNCVESNVFYVEADVAAAAAKRYRYTRLHVALAPILTGPHGRADRRACSAGTVGAQELEGAHEAAAGWACCATW